MPAPLRLGVLNEPGGALVLVDAGHFMVIDFRIEVQRLISGKSLRAPLWRSGTR